MEPALNTLLRLRPQFYNMIRPYKVSRFLSQHAPALCRVRPLLPRPPPARIIPQLSVRHNGTSSTPIDPSRPPSQAIDPSPREEVPAYEVTITCKPCLHRSAHRISKQGYHKGSILVTCPSCKNRHVISDHLKIFSDKTVTIEDLMRDKGELVKMGTLGEEGDVEFWDDGSQTDRVKQEYDPTETRRY